MKEEFESPAILYISGLYGSYSYRDDRAIIVCDALPGRVVLFCVY